MQAGERKEREPAPFRLPGLSFVVRWVFPAWMLAYLTWRALFTLNPAAWALSLALWLAEAFGVANYVLFAWMTRSIAPTRRWRPAPPGLTVDVFVPTYDEDPDVLEATILGCKQIAYPHRTYVLDDGRRPAVRALCERHGVEYLARPDNRHAKAGNLNWALARTRGEFLLVLDADMVPRPEILDRTLGYFVDDPKLAFVQLPQEFYNRDSIQHDRRRQDWHEQSLFFHVIQPGKNHSNSAFWCGSPAVLRRAALEDVGGVATETITEDIHTSVRLHARGWNSYFVDEALAFGIAPPTFTAYVLQRLRWARGTMQLYRSKESPLWIRGLTWQQRLSYIASFLAYVESLQKLVFVLVPPAIVFTGALPIVADLRLFLLVWGPYFLLNVLANEYGGRGYYRYWATQRYSFLRMVAFLQALPLLFVPARLTFRVTPKRAAPGIAAQERRALRVHAILLGLLVATVFVGGVELARGVAGALPPLALAIVCVWGAYNAAVIASGVLEVLRRRHDRADYRFRVRLPATIESPAGPLPALIVDLSQRGARLRLPAGSRTERALLTVAIPQAAPVRARLLRERHRAAVSAGVDEVGVELTPVTEADRYRLLTYLYISGPVIEARPPAQGLEARAQVA